jgi:hypothetical protein
VNKKALFALVWVALFVGTVAVRGIFAEGRTSRVLNSEEERAQLQRELEAMPRKTLMLSPNLLTADPAAEAFDEELSMYIRTHTYDLQLCKEIVMPRSRRPTEYFELSFVPRAVLVDGSKRIVQLDEVVVERATIALTPSDERCIVEAFRALEPNVHTVPASRVTYQICFQNRSSISG